MKKYHDMYILFNLPLFQLSFFFLPYSLSFSFFFFLFGLPVSGVRPYLGSLGDMFPALLGGS